MMRKLFFATLIIFSIQIDLANARDQNINSGFADVVEDLLPAVVNISTTQKATDDINQILKKLPEDKVFDQIKSILTKQSLQQKQSSSLGSGFIISKDGYIATKQHVIENAAEVFINLSDGSKFTAKIIGIDKKTDLALLKINTGYDLKYVKFGDSDKSRIGDWVIVIGNPFGLGGSVSAGIVSARGRDVISGQGDFIQTDAAINRGNSGGPLFNIKGEVIGIATAIFSTSGGNIGIGFAGTSNDSVPIIEQLKTQGTVVRGWIGVSIQDVSVGMAKALGMAEPKGALVTENIKDGASEKAGIVPSDVIVKFGDKDIKNVKMLLQVVSATPVGKKVKVVVIRQGEEKTFTAKVQKMPDNFPEKGDDRSNKKFLTTNILAMGLIDLNKQTRKEYKIEDRAGVLIAEVKPISKASEAGIISGDIILSANQTPVKSVTALQKIILDAIDSDKGAVLLLIKRKDQQLSVVLDLSSKSS